MMEEIDRFQDPTAASISDRDCDAREGETVAMNYKPSPLQVKLEKQRELARKGSLKNGNMGSPVNQQPKKNNVMARTRLVVPNKGYSSLDQSPDEKPLVALDTDSDDDFDMSRYSSSGYSSAELVSPKQGTCSAQLCSGDQNPFLSMQSLSSDWPASCTTACRSLEKCSAPCVTQQKHEDAFEERKDPAGHQMERQEKENKQ
ncbi:protein FAM219A isoform 2-T2 [Rhynochetos jubatus]